MTSVTIDVVPVNGKAMWRATVNGRQYLEHSGQRLQELVSRLTSGAGTAGRLDSAQN